MAARPGRSSRSSCSRWAAAAVASRRRHRRRRHCGPPCIIEQLASQRCGAILCSSEVPAHGFACARLLRAIARSVGCGGRVLAEPRAEPGYLASKPLAGCTSREKRELGMGCCGGAATGRPKGRRAGGGLACPFPARYCACAWYTGCLSGHCSWVPLQTRVLPSHACAPPPSTVHRCRRRQILTFLIVAGDTLRCPAVTQIAHHMCW